MPADFALLLARDLACFASDHPGLKLALVLSTRRLDLHAEPIDVAVRMAGSLESSSLIVRKAFELEFGLFLHFGTYCRAVTNTRAQRAQAAPQRGRRARLRRSGAKAAPRSSSHVVDLALPRARRSCTRFNSTRLPRVARLDDANVRARMCLQPIEIEHRPCA